MPELLRFDFPNKIIEVPIPDTNLDLQYLINQIREAEDDITPGMAYSKIADAFGKQDLGGGVRVGITVVLLDGWRIRFEARTGPETISVRIEGGNFVGEAGANPIAPSSYTQVTVAQSTSATLVSSQADTNLVYLVETLRSMHPAFGTAIYWDPENGSNANSGLTPSNAVKTFAAAHDLVTSGNNDVIFCRPTGSGTTTTTETLNIHKNNLKVRGPGIQLKIIPEITTAPTVNISANNVEFSGFYLETAATGTQNALTVTGDNNLVRDCWIASSQTHGISITSSARLRLLTSVIEHCGKSGSGNGIHINNNTTQSLISKCIINDNQNGITLSGSSTSDNIIENCLIYKNLISGVSIDSGVNRTILRSANTIVNNGTSNEDNVVNAGTDTYKEASSEIELATDIAGAVWDEVIADHQTIGTTGQTLSQIKKKATLASLK